MKTAVPAAMEGIVMPQKIKVVLNGCEELVQEGATILDLLALLNEHNQHLIVEHNDFFFPPSKYATRTVEEGDTVEFINPNLGG
jgi:thiamine biosynthesis protein ThiS